MEQYLQVGVITTTHGVRGEVKVFPTTDDPQRFKELTTVLMENGTAYTKLDVSGVKFFKNQVILKFRQFDNINEVEKYRGRGLFVSRSEAVPLAEDEYYYGDLIGLRALLSDGSSGQLTQVIETGANDVYEITMDRDKKKILVPAIRQCIKKVDLEQGTMEIDLLPGLA